MKLRPSVQFSTPKKEVPAIDLHRADNPKARPCLVCRSPFLSAWAGERICRGCKSKAAWRNGVLRS
jgi:hypothetical protein